jgi:HAD superfamily hydrolase (TIGR01549 family)
VNNIKAIIFDYDGVIAESVDVKTEAFAELYKPFGKDIVQKVIAHHEANGGISRFEKFKIYHKEFLGEELNQTGVELLANKFSKLVFQKVIESPYVKGAYEFISSNHKKYNFFISTGTPTDEIEKTLIKKQIRHYFKEVYGSPEKKDSHVKKILENYGFKRDETIFVGDASTDREAAKNNNITFIGRFTTDIKIKKEPYLFDNFTELNIIINSL